MSTTPQDIAAASGSSAIQDRRPKPPGVLPRQVQMWLMAGIALVILLIILVTGRTEPAARPTAAAPTASAPLPITERIRSYQQQLAADEARQRQILAQQSAAERVAPAREPGELPPAPDPIADERRRREYQSLFSDNIVLSRRPNGQQPYGELGGKQPAAAPVAGAVGVSEQLAQLQRIRSQAPASSAPRGDDAAPTPSAPRGTGTAHPSSMPLPEPVRDENPAAGERLRLPEGTVIETALINRLEGTFAGPVACLVTSPVYSQDRQSILIPAGARVLGNAAPVQTWGDSRLAVSFHRLVMPDGHTYSLDRFKGLDQSGETGLRDSVNRHYLQVFGASLAIGAISGLAQYNTRSGFDYTFGDAYRQAAGASLASSTSRVLDRYLNVLPTITVREGFRIKVYLTNDLDLPAYAAINLAGGAR